MQLSERLRRSFLLPQTRAVSGNEISQSIELGEKEGLNESFL